MRARLPVSFFYSYAGDQSKKKNKKKYTHPRVSLGLTYRPKTQRTLDAGLTREGIEPTKFGILRWKAIRDPEAVTLCQMTINDRRVQ